MATVGMRYLALPKEPISMADEILTVAEVALLLKVAGNPPGTARSPPGSVLMDSCAPHRIQCENNVSAIRRI